MKPAVFLDRDGTIIYDRGFLTHPDELVMLPGAIDGLLKLQAEGYALVVITNQSGIGRGLIQPEELENLHYGPNGLVEQLKTLGINIVDIYHCPHHPTEALEPYRQVCQCRKPAPGMVLEAAEIHALDLENSWMIGDRMRDVMCGINAGTQGIHLLADELLKEQAISEVAASETSSWEKKDNEGHIYYQADVWPDVLAVIDTAGR